MKRIGLFSLAGLIVGLDQLSKLFILQHFHAGGAPLSILPGNTPGLRIILAYNRGISFSLFSTDSALFYMLMSFLISGLLLFIGAWMWREKDRLTQICLALILGGGLGNVGDRFFRGAVVDFIDAYWHVWHWPTFNVADIAVSMSALILFIHTVRAAKKI